MPQASHQTHQLNNTEKIETKSLDLIKRIKPISFSLPVNTKLKKTKFHLLRDVILRYYKRLLMLLIIPTSILIFCVYCTQR
jgi:hypothetical protein